MKIIYSIILLFLLSTSPVKAELVELYPGVVLDTSTIREVQGSGELYNNILYSGWSYADCNELQYDELCSYNGESIEKVKAEFIIDCSNISLFEKYMVSYTSKSGFPLESSDLGYPYLKSQFHSIVPNSVGYKMYEIICGTK